MSEPQAYTDGPNTHKYTTANHVTTWTVIPLHDPVTGIKHRYHVPVDLVEEIERQALERAPKPEPPRSFLDRLRSWFPA